MGYLSLGVNDPNRDGFACLDGVDIDLLRKDPISHPQFHGRKRFKTAVDALALTGFT